MRPPIRPRPKRIPNQASRLGRSTPPHGEHWAPAIQQRAALQAKLIRLEVIRACSLGGLPVTFHSDLQTLCDRSRYFVLNFEDIGHFSSYRSDQRWYPSTTLTTWADMRSRLPALRRLPSRTVPTFSRPPKIRKSTCSPLKVNVELRGCVTFS